MAHHASAHRLLRPITVALILAWPASAAARPLAPAAAAVVYAGWAMDAYPGDSTAVLRSQMQAQQDAGATLVWLGQNNPGEVNRAKGEPGLSFAVWQALQNSASPRHADAAAMLLAVQNALAAAQSLGLPVVLPVGYQIQMGAAWNASHAGDLRLGALGRVYINGGQSASFYAPAYQHDIVAYYRWVDRTLVRPYRGTIRLLNLADEPSDGDYSPWASAEFKRRYGFDLRQAGKDPKRQLLVGRFQAEYVAEYAAWSARQWLAIDPEVRVTLSFDGGWSRYKHEGPDLEAIFRLAPDNLDVTFDAYPRDGLFRTALRTQDLVTLFSLVGTLGHFSALYHRPIWLWSTANSWGLNGASADPGTVADAAANGIYLAQLARQAGGDLRGVAVWNYNIRGQGLFGDTHPYTYDPRNMFTRVSATLPLLRAIMQAPAGRPRLVILASNTADLLAAGRTLAMRAVDRYDWSALDAVARTGMATAVVTHLADDCRGPSCTVVVLDREAGDLRATDRAALTTLLRAGGTVVAAAPVATLLRAGGSVVAAPSGQTLAAGGNPAMAVRRYAVARGTLYEVIGAPVERLFAANSRPWAGGVVRALLGAPDPNGGFGLSAGKVSLFYSGLDSPAVFSLDMPLAGSPATLTVYDQSGRLVRTISLAGHPGTVLRLQLPRRTYALAVAG